MNKQIINIKEQPNGTLLIECTNKDELNELINSGLAYDAIWVEILEPFSTNGSYSLIEPELVGALTDAPIIAKDKLFWENATIDYMNSSAKLWYYSDYMIKSEFEELLENGSITLISAN